MRATALWAFGRGGRGLCRLTETIHLHRKQLALSFLTPLRHFPLPSSSLLPLFFFFSQRREINLHHGRSQSFSDFLAHLGEWKPVPNTASTLKRDQMINKYLKRDSNTMNQRNVNLNNRGATLSPRMAQVRKLDEARSW